MSDVADWWRTAIIDMEPGRIAIRGHPIEELIGAVSFPDMIWLMLRVRSNGNKITRGAVHLAGFVLFVQVFLGVVTVLYISPLHLAVLHQLFAVAVWCAILRARFLAGYPVETSIRG